MGSKRLNNLKAIPERKYGPLTRVSDEMILHMRDEIAGEIYRVFPELRELAKARNGLEVLEREIRLRKL